MSGRLTDKKIIIKAKVISNSLYSYAEGYAQTRYMAENAHLEKKLQKLQSQVSSLEAAIAPMQQRQAGKEEAEIMSTAQRMGMEIEETEARISSLQKKIFGRKKAREEAAVLETSVERQKQELSELQERLSAIQRTAEQAWRAELQEKQEKLEKKQAALESLTKEKQQVLLQYSDWVCVLGEDCQEEILNKPPAFLQTTIPPNS